MHICNIMIEVSSNCTQVIADQLSSIISRYIQNYLSPLMKVLIRGLRVVHMF